MVDDHEHPHDPFVMRLLSEMLSGLATITVEHLGLLQYLKDRGLIDRESYARFLDSYRAEHLQRTLDELKQACRADRGDDLGNELDQR